MCKTKPDQLPTQKAAVLAWLIVAVCWSLVRLVIESIEPTELGWGPIVYLIEMIYIALLGLAFIVLATFRDKGLRGLAGIAAGTLLGLVLPLYEVFSSGQISWTPILYCVPPGFFLGLIYALLRRSSAREKGA